MKTHFGRYEITRELATGGMAELFVARASAAEGFAREVVIKCVLPELAGDDQFIECFLNEARLSANLSHPNIVQVFDLGLVDERYFLAMEYVRGYDLWLLLEEARKRQAYLPLNVALRILLDLLAGLAYAHEARDIDGEPLGIVHRDVTPSNVLVATTGMSKVVDFGIAKATARSERRTATGQVKGKYSYLTPEQINGEVIDNRLDLFAAAIMFYELLTGRNPFKADTEYHTLMNIVSRPAAPLSTHRPDLHAALQPVIDRGLAKAPAHRYSSATEMARAVEECAKVMGVVPSHTAVADYVKANEALLEVAREKLVSKLASTTRLSGLDTMTQIELPEEGVAPDTPAGPAHRRWARVLVPASVLLAMGLGAAALRQTMTPRTTAPVVTEVIPLAPEVTAPEAGASAPVSQPASTQAPPPLGSKPELPRDKERGRKKRKAEQVAATVVAEEATGLVKFLIVPYGVIRIDGKLAGTTPIAPRELPVGAHTISIENPDLHQRVTRSVIVKKGVATIVEHDFGGD